MNVQRIIDKCRAVLLPVRTTHRGCRVTTTHHVDADRAVVVESITLEGGQ